MVRRIARWLCVALALPSAGGATSCRPGTETPDVTTVTVWAHQGRELENAAMRRIVAAFNEAHREHNLQAEISFFPDRQYPDKVSITSASGPLPDILDIDGPYVGPWAAEGLLQPLNGLVNDKLRADFLPSIIEQGTFDGRLYALGAFDSALVVYYNRDVIEKAGLQPPDTVAHAWTWGQFVAALHRVKPQVAVPLSLHMDDQSDEWFTYAFSPLVWSNGGGLIDAVGHRASGVLNGPASVEAVAQWQALFKSGLAQPTSTNPNPFAAGQAAFDWTGHWMVPSFEAAKGLRFGVMPLPRMGDNTVCGCGSWCWGISRDCKERSAAWKVMQWLLDPQRGIKPIVKANGAVPGRRSAFDLFPVYQKLPYKLFREQLEQSARPRPRTAVYLTLTSEFARALRDVALGADPEARLTEAADTVQRVLDRL